METRPAPSFAEHPHGVPTDTAAKTSEQSNEALQDIAFGSIAGIVGKIVEYPFDTVKVRLQSQPDHLPLRYKGPLDCFKQSVAQDGVRGLYRGVSAPLAGAAAENACLFYSYTLGQNLLRKTLFRIPEDQELPLNALVSAGAFSGGVTSLVLTPIELVKCRMQAPVQASTLAAAGTMAQPSPFAVIKDVFRSEGLLGFWRGQFGTFLRETGGSAAWFGGWEASTLFFKTRLAKAEGKPAQDVTLPVTQQMASGALAGISYNFLFYPADTIKSKIQTGELSHTGVKPTFSNVGRELYGTHGLKGLYRGCGITCMRSAPSSALIFTIVANLKALFE
ncbi:hypothetical protein KC332_g9799 [Hortaea werneckii]|uniref:Amino-acid transporter arg-13 n=2 Tax=Hortaea werneckii TaxID=91943 RepID=A0A3M7IJS8_HORWE|nr:hypothetical protein KC358_g9681 [Hortaea werneckii]OTA37873.1 hypothetical protein BTJ68_02427 [Hortaea werneckii EXF-2000]KAI6824713.1 hypothetical protein KC350_g8950 [Hortaea werneckii]KAI6944568.1 hypothetical protein KC341_g709 [Hortaea werneckii]KAI6950209.1 hypothetical protein KC348_g806 [Hortaea werneckii]